jgi:MFS family permease
MFIYQIQVLLTILVCSNRLMEAQRFYYCTIFFFFNNFKQYLKLFQKNSGKFVWSKQVQGFVLSSYFYGYIITQILAGWLSMKYGGKIVLGLAMLFGSIMTVLAPVCANVGYGLLILCRFVTGLAHGAVWPPISSLFINWAPPQEKSRLIGFSTSGTYVGNVIALPVGGYLCANGFADGWGSIFYIFGFVGIIWFILLMILTSNKPQNHKFISELEKNFIVDSISNQTVNDTRSLIKRVKR